jgi:hypothetical protein
MNILMEKYQSAETLLDLLLNPNTGKNPNNQKAIAHAARVQTKLKNWGKAFDFAKRGMEKERNNTGLREDLLHSM